MFNHFLKERFAQKQDLWTALEEKTRPYSRNSFAENDRWGDLICYPTGTILVASI